jgi:hypothetical protein
MEPKEWAAPQKDDNSKFDKTRARSSLHNPHFFPKSKDKTTNIRNGDVTFKPEFNFKLDKSSEMKTPFANNGQICPEFPFIKVSAVLSTIVNE